MFHKYLILLLIIIICAGCGEADLSLSQTKEKYYDTLARIKLSKAESLKAYFAAIKEKADEITADEAMHSLFLKKLRIYNAIKQQGEQENLVTEKYRLRNEIENRYIDNYLIFNDILLINKNGDIFYTIKRQNDYHKNIFSEELSSTMLSRQLLNADSKSFVDFSLYSPIEEAAAFFVRPFLKEGELAGWFVMEFSVDKLSDIFPHYAGLGSTGEVILVNKDRILLTNSRFYPEKTTFSKQLSKQNISEKFRIGNGRKKVIDYRNKTALTSFTVFNTHSSEWLLIAKIDQDEVYNEHYKSMSKQAKIQLIQTAARSALRNGKARQPVREVEVDMDEARYSDNEDILYTHGVSYCTGVVVAIPGKFAYLAHISPYDKIYGGGHTDILNNIIRSIKRFNAPESELGKIKVYFISPNIRFDSTAVDDLVANGISLSNIYLINNKTSKYADFSYDQSKGSLVVLWSEKGRYYNTDIAAVKPLSEYLR